MACNLQNVFLHGGKFPAFEEPITSRRLSFINPASLSSSRKARTSVSCSTVVDDMSATDALDSKALTNRWQIFIDRTAKTTSNTGKFGRFGGKFVPETLITCLSMLEAEFNLALLDTDFQVLRFIYLFKISQLKIISILPKQKLIM